MKASDIPDETFIEIVREYNEGRYEPVFHPERTAWPGTSIEFKIPAYTESGPRAAMIWDLEDRLGIPRKVILAKARSLLRRGLLIEGCSCGCRGDFVVVEPDYHQHHGALEAMGIL